MLRVLYWLLLDSAFVYILVAFGSEAGGYIILILAAIAFFTWELIHSIKNLR